MRVFLLSLALVLSYALPVFATNVSGLITTNTTWTKSNSPYIVTGNIDVDTNATLTIEPGVVVKFDGFYVVYIDGKISMQGTDSDSIVVTSNKAVPGKADYIGFDVRNSKSLDTLKFEYCHFLYASRGVHVENMPAIVKNCVFEYCGAAIANNNITRSYTYVDNCRFYNNSTAIYSYGAVIATNNIVMNCISWGFYASEWNNANYCANNVFYNNYNTIVKYNYVLNNVIYKSGNIGIRDCGTISHNQVWYCQTGIFAGLNIMHNGIKYNQVGVIINNSTSLVHLNCFSDNATYDFINNGSDIDISDNYWSEPDSAKIAGRVQDFYDNFTSGKALFMPVLQSEDSGCLDSLQLPDTTTTNHTNDTTLSTKEVSLANGIDLYPNPATNTVIIKTGNNDAIKMICLYTVTGSIVQQIETNTNKVILNITSLPNGMYLVKVFTADGKAQVTKLLKE